MRLPGGASVHGSRFVRSLEAISYIPKGNLLLVLVLVLVLVLEIGEEIEDEDEDEDEDENEQVPLFIR